MHTKLKVLVSVIATSAMVGGIAAAASSPSVTTGSASSIKTTSAVLHGAVNPNGSGTSYTFQWGLTSAYGVNGASHSAGSGTAAKSVSATAGGLLPGTPYHYRLIATNRFGVTVGADRTFKTRGNPPPEVATGPATSISTSSAIVTGVINPQNETTSYFFQFGLTPAYGFQTFTATVPAGSVPVTVSLELQGLSPGTFFHYRLVALHPGFGAQFGPDMSFLTFFSPRLATRVRANTRPKRARSRPFTFTTTGSVSLPPAIPAALGCAQNAIVRFFFGQREWAATVMPVQANCTFSGTTVIGHLPGRGNRHRKERLRVLVTARGNGYAASTSARNQTVVLGG